MKKRIIRSGLVASLKDDFEGASSSFEDNLKRRMRMLCSRPGPRYDPDATLDLSTAIVAPDRWMFRLVNVGFVVFEDYDFWCPDDLTTLTSAITFTALGDYYVSIVKNVESSTPGDFMPGYPEDTDTYTHEEVTAALSVSADYSRGAESIPLYKVSYDGSSITVLEDYRQDVCMVPNSDIYISPGELVITGLTASVKDLSVLQQEQDQVEGQAASFYNNLLSHPRNSVRNGSIINIEWSTVERDVIVWAYHVKVVPYSGTSPDISKAFHTMVLAQPGQYTSSFSMPVVRGMKYQIGVRAISSSLNRILGPWAVVNPGATVLVPRPKPSAMVLTARSDNPASYLWTPPETEPEDLESVCIKRTSNGISDIVYEGGFCPVVLEATPVYSSFFSVRMKYMDGTMSPWSDSVLVAGNSGSSYGGSTPQHMTIMIPVDIMMADNMDNKSYVATFAIPKNGGLSLLRGRIIEAVLYARGMTSLGVHSNTLSYLSLTMLHNGNESIIMKWDDDIYSVPDFDQPSAPGGFYAQIHPREAGTSEAPAIDVIPGQSASIICHFECDSGDAFAINGMLALEMEYYYAGAGGVS